MNRFDHYYSLALLLLFATGVQAAPERRADELFPATTAIYAEAPRMAQTLEFLLDHPLTRKLRNTGAFQKALQKKENQELWAVVAFLEAHFGMEWRGMLMQATAGGLYVAVDAETQGVALLIKAADADLRHRALEKIIGLARADATGKGQDDPYEQHSYRGFTAYQVGDVIITELGSWLLVANNADLGKHVANAFLDGNVQSLATAAWFQEARKSVSGAPAVWAAFDVATVRKAGVSEDLFRERTDNIVAEIIMGGIHETLCHTPLATASIDLDDEEVRLRLATPFEEDWISDSRKYFFAGAAPERLELTQQVLALSTFRDLAYVWLHAPDLFEEKAVDETAKAESGLSNLFGGKDFGEEVLGALHPDMQLVVSRQEFGERTPQPAIKLPSFALVARLRDAEAMQPELRRAFQSIVGFLNVVGSTQGQPQLDMNMESADAFQLVTSAYLPNDDNRESRQASINYNFSPSIAFAGDRFILASTQEIARSLATARPTEVHSHTELMPEHAANTLAHVNVAELQQILAENREHLISNNMLEKGHEREAAEREVDTLLALLELVEGGNFSFTMAPSQLEFQLNVDLATQ